MSSIPEDFQVSVSNWKGTRTVSSSISEVLGEAQGLASGVIANVGTVLDALQNSGGIALEDAAAAVAALGAFSPMAIAVNYSPPGINNPGFLEPGALTLSETGIGDPPETGSLNVPIYTPPAPEVGGVPPVAGTVAFGDAPTPQNFFEPPAPNVGTTKAIGAVPGMTYVPFEATLPAPPSMRELVLPTFVPQPFPEYVPPPVQSVPAPPSVNISLDGLPSYTPIFVPGAAPRLGGVLVRDLVTERDLRSSYETYRLRGCPLDEEQELDQIRDADESTRLMNQAESRQLIIDEGLLGAESERLALRFLVQYQVVLIELAVAIAKLYFEAMTAQAEALLSLAKAMTSYYNALVAQYAADADLYKLGIEQEVARMKYWEGLVQAEVAKSKANAQSASLYVQTEQVETIKGDIYQAQVSGIVAQAERYKAEIEALVAKAEVAKTSVTVFRGSTEAYAAGVAAYKAHFDAYAATTQSVSAQNQAQMQTSELSLAEAQRVSAEAAIISTNLEVAAEQFKAQAAKIGSSYEEAKLINTIEANRAQIASSHSRIQSLYYVADKQVGEIQNEAASSYANQATRYLSSASDAAYRASEQTLKAITAATQAAAVAQEAAGRTSAALSQGAYSAVHVSAGLRGSGRMDGNENHYAKSNQHFSDMLNYTESKDSVVSA